MTSLTDPPFSRVPVVSLTRKQSVNRIAVSPTTQHRLLRAKISFIPASARSISPFNWLREKLPSLPWPASQSGRHRRSSPHSCPPRPANPLRSKGRAALRRDDAYRCGGDELFQRRFLERSGCDQRVQRQARATAAPVMAAVRVPPSAWITSQSRITVRSPRAFMSTTERRLRPIRR